MSIQNQKIYSLVDSGHGRKLERFGPYVLSRPCSQAVWAPLLPEQDWRKSNAVFLREGDTRWTYNTPNMPQSWTVDAGGISFKISPTDFGHLGIFPEQSDFWEWIPKIVQNASKKRSAPIHVLNLFAYSGGSTLAAAKGGAHVCHLDASKGMVTWARENAALNQLEGAPIRWIIEDVEKFVQRELRRGKRYDAIILDPPTFGRGNKGEIFKIEEGLPNLLRNCRQLLSDHPLFVLFSCHTPGFSPTVMHHLLSQMMTGLEAPIDIGEMLLKGEKGVLTLPSGTYARWSREH